jgi:transglycosylase-like protein with SLT domain
MKSIILILAILISLVIAPAAGISSELDVLANLTNLVGTLQPSLSSIEKVDIADALLEISHDQKCEIPLLMLLSVAVTESALKKSAYNKKTKDSGLMQINDKMIKRLNLSQTRLMTDVHYSLKVGCFLLTEAQHKYSPKRPYWVGVYNAGTALWDMRVVQHAKAYDKKIQARMKKIKAESEKLVADGAGMHYQDKAIP